MSYITGLLPRNEHIGIAFRQEHPLFLDHPLFAKRLREWLKTLRKKNVKLPDPYLPAK